MARQHNVNGVKIPFTAEEETARDAEEAQAVIDRQAEADAIAQKVTDKASAKAKLIAGEALTEAEADTIVI
jgi:secreted protein with Ig-like and vWFA domain